MFGDYDEGVFQPGGNTAEEQASLRADAWRQQRRLRVQTSDEDESKHYEMLSSLRSEFRRSQKEAELLK